MSSKSALSIAPASGVRPLSTGSSRLWPRVGALMVGALVGSLLTGGAARALVGNDTPEGAFRFVAKVQVGDPMVPGSRASTGALVAPRWVVTAKVCFGTTGVQAGPPKTDCQ